MLNLKDKKSTAFVLMGPLAIVAAFGAISLAATFMVFSLGQARINTKDARIQAQMSQIRGLAEISYNQDDMYDNICTSTEIADLLVEIEQQSGAPAVCFASGDDYCISSPLASDPTKYFCIGANGVTGESVCASARTECK